MYNNKKEISINVIIEYDYNLEIVNNFLINDIKMTDFHQLSTLL